MIFARQDSPVRFVVLMPDGEKPPVGVVSRKIGPTLATCGRLMLESPNLLALSDRRGTLFPTGTRNKTVGEWTARGRALQEHLSLVVGAQCRAPEQTYRQAPSKPCYLLTLSQAVL
jgi:glutaredoxin 2